VGKLIVHDSAERRISELVDILGELGQNRVTAGPADPTGCDMVFNATPMGMAAGDPLPVAAHLLASSMFVGDVIAGHGETPFLQAAHAAGCEAANGDQMVAAVQEMMVDFMLGL
jgi:shikimate dehydrogenase